MGLLNTLTVVSYVALTADLLLQIRRIHHTRSSDDLSLPGLTIRFFAITTILVKFISMRSTILIVGHGMIRSDIRFVLYSGDALLFSPKKGRGVFPWKILAEVQ